MVTFSKLGVVQDGQAQKAAQIHGDILEAIFSHVPLMDLVHASHVSKSWNRAVSSYLRHLNDGLKPWLIIHTQSSRSPYGTTAHAYDPRSHVWIKIKGPLIEYVSALRSSHSTLLYMLSPSKLSFSFDPLHLTWHHADAPLVWRTDPIVAAVGHRIVVAGGTCDFEDDPLAVEIYDFVSRKWSTCESMPSVLKDSAASTWLSIATDDQKLYVSEKHSGVTHSFDPETVTWCGPYYLRPDPGIFYSVIGFSNDRMILIGLIRDVEEGEMERVKIWEVSCESLECEEIGEMPMVLVEKLKSDAFEVTSVGLCVGRNMMYIYNPLKVEEVFICEVVNGGCRWGSVVASDRNPVERCVLTCSKVGIDVLQGAMMRSDYRTELIRLS